MPKNDTPVRKVQAIRDYLAEHPDASPRAVGEALVAQGFQISSAFVSAVQARLESANRSDDSVNGLLVTLGKAQVEAMILQIQSSDQWNYFQAKSIKSSLLTTKTELLTALGKTV